MTGRARWSFRREREPLRGAHLPIDTVRLQPRRRSGRPHRIGCRGRMPARGPSLSRQRRKAARGHLGLRRVVPVADRDLVTQVRIDWSKRRPGLGRANALRACSLRERCGCRSGRLLGVDPAPQPGAAAVRRRNTGRETFPVTNISDTENCNAGQSVKFGHTRGPRFWGMVGAPSFGRGPAIFADGGAVRTRSAPFQTPICGMRRRLHAARRFLGPRRSDVTSGGVLSVSPGPLDDPPPGKSLSAQHLRGHGRPQRPPVVPDPTTTPRILPGPAQSAISARPQPIP